MARVGLTPERLVLAGAELADELGFDAVTLSAVARRFDVKVASLYSHLSGSADLKDRIAVHALQELAARASSALVGRSGRDALLGFAGAYRAYAAQHPGRYAATRHPLPDDLLGAGRAHAELTLAVLRGYGLQGDDAVHAVRLIGSTVHGFIALERAGGFAHSAPPSEESWGRIVDALDLTLRQWSDGRPAHDG